MPLTDMPPPSEECFKLVLRPSDWKARLWRAFDGSVTVLLRLDCPLALRDVEDRRLRDLLAPFETALRSLNVYLERGAGAPLAFPWAVGRLVVDRERAVAWLHRVLDDPFGAHLATLFRVNDSRADLTLSLAPHESGRDRLDWALRDYDIGVGGGFRR